MKFIAEPLYKEMLECLPILCVDVLIIYESKCPLLLRDNEPAKGQYWFPGGRIYKNESIREAALRKAKEETNLECIFEEIVSVEETIFEKNNDMITDIHTVNICCVLSVKDISSLKIDDLHKNVKWINKLSQDLHDGLISPLKKIGFTY